MSPCTCGRLISAATCQPARRLRAIAAARLQQDLEHDGLLVVTVELAGHSRGGG
jgi:hypothetical protein